MPGKNKNNFSFIQEYTSNFIQKIRARECLTQEELRIKLGIGQSCISQLENDSYFPSLKIIVKMYMLNILKDNDLPEMMEWYSSKITESLVRDVKGRNIEVNNIVMDLTCQKYAVIVDIHEWDNKNLKVIIQYDKDSEEEIERRPQDLECILWTKEDISKAKKEAERFMKIFGGDKDE